MRWIALVGALLLCYLVVMGIMSWLSTAPSAPPPRPDQTHRADFAQPPARVDSPTLYRGGIEALAAALTGDPSAGPTADASAQAEKKEKTEHRVPNRPEASLAERADQWAVDLRNKAATHPEAAATHGQKLLDAGHSEWDRQVFDRALKRHPNHFRLLVGKALAASAMGQFTVAADAYGRAVQAKADDPAVWFNYAVTLTRLERFSSAEDAYSKVLELQPDHPKAAYNLASLSQRQGKISQALHLWEGITERAPKLASAWFHRGTACMDLHEYDQATNCFRRVTDLQPDRVDGWHNLGLALLAAGRFDQAIPTLEKCIAIDPQQPRALSALGQAHWEKYKSGPPDSNQRKAAIRRLRQALALNPNQPDTHAILDAIFDQQNPGP